MIIKKLLKQRERKDESNVRPNYKEGANLSGGIR